MGRKHIHYSVWQGAAMSTPRRDSFNLRLEFLAGNHLDFGRFHEIRDNLPVGRVRRHNELLFWGLTLFRLIRQCQLRLACLWRLRILLSHDLPEHG